MRSSTRKLAAYEASPDYSTFDADILDGILTTLHDEFGPDFFLRVMSAFVPYESRLPFTFSSEAQSLSFFVAVCSAAAQSDLRPRFVDLWGFTIDPDYYDDIYPKVQQMVSGFSVWSISPDQATPFTADGATAVTWTTTVVGAYGPLTYQFRRSKEGGEWSLVQDYGTSNAYTWTPTTSDGGQYQILSCVRNEGSTADYDTCSSSETFTVVGEQLSITSLTADRATPFTADGTTAVTWTATAVGGSGPLTYQFWRAKNGAAWSLVQDYSASHTYAWTPTPADGGQYQIRAYVRNSGSVAAYDARNWSAPFTVLGTPLAITSLTPEPGDAVHGGRDDGGDLDGDDQRRLSAA